MPRTRRKLIKQVEFLESTFMRFRGDYSQQKDESISRTVTVWRSNNEDIPKKYYGYCYRPSDDESPLYNFFQYIFKWLKEQDINFSVFYRGVGQKFMDEPVIYIEKNFIIIMQEGGYDV